MMAAIAILAAAIHREKTGEGQFLDVSMMDGVVSWLCIHAGKYFMDGSHGLQFDRGGAAQIRFFHSFRGAGVG